jgi:hypothetical protein
MGGVGTVPAAGSVRACTRATHNARSHLALSRFSSGRPAPAPRCKGISLHLAAPCTRVQADFPASAPPVRVVCTEFWHLRCGLHVQGACSGLFRRSVVVKQRLVDSKQRFSGWDLIVISYPVTPD